jgi:hypothetical protein
VIANVLFPHVDLEMLNRGHNGGTLFSCVVSRCQVCQSINVNFLPAKTLALRNAFPGEIDGRLRQLEQQDDMEEPT